MARVDELRVVRSSRSRGHRFIVFKRSPAIVSFADMQTSVNGRHAGRNFTDRSIPRRIEQNVLQVVSPIRIIPFTDMSLYYNHVHVLHCHQKNPTVLPRPRLVSICSVRLGRLRFELLLNLHERLGALVIHQPFTLCLFVKRQDRQSRDTAVASGLLQEPLGAWDTDLAECPVGFRGEPLQFECGFERFCVGCLCQGGRGSEQLFKAVL